MTKSSPPLKFKLSNYGFRNSSGSLAMLAAIRCASSRPTAASLSLVYQCNPPNATKTSNERANANARPSPTATGSGKPSRWRFLRNCEGRPYQPSDDRHGLVTIRRRSNLILKMDYASGITAKILSPETARRSVAAIRRFAATRQRTFDTTNRSCQWNYRIVGQLSRRKDIYA